MQGPTKNRFDEIFRTGIRESGSALRVISISGSGLVGFATQKSIGNKPQRNRQKRRAKEALRLCKIDLHPQRDYVITSNTNCVKVALPDLIHELGELLSKTEKRWEERSASGL